MSPTARPRWRGTEEFPELMEKEIFHADVEFIGPIMEQTTKEFGQIFLGL